VRSYAREVTTAATAKSNQSCAQGCLDLSWHPDIPPVIAESQQRAEGCGCGAQYTSARGLVYGFTYLLLRQIRVAQSLENVSVPVLGVR
jgi:hypothetical protein